MNLLFCFKETPHTQHSGLSLCKHTLLLPASVPSLARDECSLGLTSKIFLFQGLNYTHHSSSPSLIPVCTSLLEQRRWAEPRPCNIRPDFHWKQMLSIRGKDRLMFSKAYNNKPRGSSHASSWKRGKWPKHGLRCGASERVKEEGEKERRKEKKEKSW